MKSCVNSFPHPKTFWQQSWNWPSFCNNLFMEVHWSGVSQWVWAGRTPTRVRVTRWRSPMGSLTWGRRSGVPRQHCIHHHLPSALPNGSAQSYPCPCCHHHHMQVLTMPPNTKKQEHQEQLWKCQHMSYSPPLALQWEHVLLWTCLLSVPWDRHHIQLHSSLQNWPWRGTAQRCFPCPKAVTGAQFFTAVSML